MKSLGYSHTVPAGRGHCVKRAFAMLNQIERLDELPPLLAADRAIALVHVPWSPGPRRSQLVLNELDATQQRWSREPIGFFVLHPESEQRLNDWYMDLCRLYEPRFLLHGNGWGPFWWLVRGTIIDCVEKPYEFRIAELVERTVGNFTEAKNNPLDLRLAPSPILF